MTELSLQIGEFLLKYVDTHKHDILWAKGAARLNIHEELVGFSIRIVGCLI